MLFAKRVHPSPEILERTAEGGLESGRVPTPAHQVSAAMPVRSTYKYTHAYRYVLAVTTVMPRIHATSVLLQMRIYSKLHPSLCKLMLSTYLNISDFVHLYCLKDREGWTRQINDARWEVMPETHPARHGEDGAPVETFVC